MKPLALAAALYGFRAAYAQVEGTTLQLQTCDVSQKAQVWTYTAGTYGVFSTGGLCLNNPGLGTPLQVSHCVGGDQNELDYRINAQNISWQGSACFTASGSVSAGAAVTLTPCAAGSPPASQQFWFNTTTNQIISGAVPSLCAAATGQPALPLLSNVFGDHMVLQRGVAAAVWGYTAATGAAVTVTVTAPDGSSVSYNTTSAGPLGLWRVSLPVATQTSSNFTITVSSPGVSNVSVTDVVYGDVYLCSGQSNMSGGNTPLAYVFNATEEIAAAAGYTNRIRIMTVGTEVSGSDTTLPVLPNAPAIPWSRASPDTVSRFSAICWLTGRDIADGLAAAGDGEVPLGFIESAWGGTSIQVWETPAAAAGACGPPPASYPGGWPTAFSSLWNSQVYPFTIGPFALLGMYWYQGESNALNGEAGYYACALPQLIADWRSAFQSPDAWFGVVQLAPWTTDASNNAWIAELRDVEVSFLQNVSKATVGTAADSGDPDAPLTSIHPRAKQAPSARLAAGALETVYGIATPTGWMGPLYAGAAAGGNASCSLSATVSFTPQSLGPAGGATGLQLITPCTDPACPYVNSSTCPAGVPASNCAGLQLQGSDGQWYAATTSSVISSGTQLLLTGPDAACAAGVKPVATSMGWAAWPVITVYNAVGLPAYPWNATL